MRLIRHLNDIKNHRPCVATIGNFDGIHIGHQKLLQQLLQLAKYDNLVSVVMSFNPSPKEFFGAKNSQITSFREKFNILAEQNINQYLIINFNKKFANISAEDFINNILLKKLNIKHLVVGNDFCFGKNRLGNVELLTKFAKLHNFKISIVDNIYHNNNRISSSNIRQALKNANIDYANAMLGRKFTMGSKIIHGSKKGKEIGFPTINIAIKRKISPILGIFAVLVMIKNQQYQGVASIGFRPILNGKKVILEVFIFHFNKLVYGEYAIVEFLYKIRDEQNFTSFDKLRQKIIKDIVIAKKYFKTIAHKK